MVNGAVARVVSTGKENFNKIGFLGLGINFIEKGDFGDRVGCLGFKKIHRFCNN